MRCNRIALFEELSIQVGLEDDIDSMLFLASVRARLAVYSQPHVASAAPIKTAVSDCINYFYAGMLLLQCLYQSTTLNEMEVKMLRENDPGF